MKICINKLQSARRQQSRGKNGINIWPFEHRLLKCTKQDICHQTSHLKANRSISLIKNTTWTVVHFILQIIWFMSDIWCFNFRRQYVLLVHAWLYIHMFLYGCYKSSCNIIYKSQFQIETEIKHFKINLYEITVLF